MKIGVDISQLAYKETGVANYLANFLEALLSIELKNDYVFFYSSLRKPLDNIYLSVPSARNNKRVTIRSYKLPPALLDIIWNRLHIFPIEWFIGDIDVFLSSDWTEPPTKNAKKVTILYDLIVYKYPQETDKIIVETQKRKMYWVKRECDVVICISQSTKNDAKDILGISEEKLKVIYPGV